MYLRLDIVVYIAKLLKLRQPSRNMFQFCASTLNRTLKFNIRELKQHKAYKLSEKVKTIFVSDMFIFRNIMILERKKDPHHYEP